jgi:hypothetical protein
MNDYGEILKTYLQDNYPEKIRQMRDSGGLEKFLTLRSKAALEQKNMLMNAGMPDHMAEE